MAVGEQDGMQKKPPKISIAKLPTVGGAIFGRRADTTWLDACWAEHAHVASIVAFGGVGKSSLVWDWLRGMQRDGWRGAERVYGWSFYSQGTTDRMTSADEFISAALRWFGDADPSGGSPWDKGERLARLVRKQRVLLVLDGVEPLQWGPGPQEGNIKDPALATLVRELGAQNPGLCVITSRLAVREAEHFPEKCRRLDLSTLTEEAGAELLRARGVKGTEEELRAAAREYGGHGLALTLLGSYLEEVGEEDVRRRRELGPLEGDERVGGHARRVMAAYERLFGSGSVEVAILKMLGLFDRPADEDEIAALRAEPAVHGLTDGVVELGTREWNRAVVKLRRVGLLARTDGAQDKRLDAHPLVREHFGEHLRKEHSEAWREGHWRLHKHLKTKANPLPETVEEMAPLYVAVVHGCRAGKNQQALEEVWRKRIRRKISRENRGFSVVKLGAFGSEVAILSAFFDPPWERLAPGLNEADGVLVLNEAGFALRALGRLPEAIEPMRLGLGQSIALQNWKEAAGCACDFGGLRQARGELREALALAIQGAELADKSGDAFSRLGSWVATAEFLNAMGRPQEAAAQFEKAEQVQKERQPAYPHLYALQGFLYCDLLLDQGRDLEVRERSTQTLRWAETDQSLCDIALNHLSLGRAHLLGVQRGGDLAQSASHLEQAVDGLRFADYQEHLPRALLARAALRTHTDAFELARRDLEDVLSFATRCGFRLFKADAHLGCARLALAEGAPAAALDHLAAARNIIDETGYHRRDEELAELEAQAAEMAKTAAPPVAATSPPTLVPPAPRSPTPMTTPQPSPVAVTTPADHKGKVDFAILTIRDDEFQAVLDRFPPFTRVKGRRFYNVHRLDLPGGGSYLVAVLKCIEQGNAEALDAARDVLEELEPRWVLVVGIAGGVPSDELTLGDVVVSTRIVDFSVEAVLQDKPSEYALMGGPVHKDAATVLANLRAVVGELGAWGSAKSIGTPRPPVEVDEAEFYGDEAWQKKARAGLARHAARTEPVVTAGAIGSSDRLVKDTKILATFLLKAARQVLAVEMESAGVYRAATGRGVPLVAIRGLSDVVGFKRDPGWTAYACHTAAAFTRAFLLTRPIEPRAAEHGASEPARPGQRPLPAAASEGTRWPAKLGGPELQELVGALLSAFPSRNALAQMLRFGLNKSLDEIAAPGNLRTTVFELITHAEAQGFVPALFDAALAAAPGNPELVALAAKRTA